MLHHDAVMGNTQSGATAARASNTASAAFNSYTQAFGALDAKAVSRYFHAPALLVTPKDVIALTTADAVEQTYAAIMRDMPPDYVRTEFRNLTERRLGDDVALVTGDGSWKNAANDDIMPFGMTYTLKRIGGNWLIVSAVIHAHGMH
jgi:ketosteroid isomerase-like protein